MDTGILHLTGRSCHDNKSQLADPFIVLSRIIAGKTKYVKDPFPVQIRTEASHARAEGGFTVFGRNRVMPGQTGSDQKERNREEGGMRYVNSGLGYTL